MTERGVQTRKQEVELASLILATGFDGLTRAMLALDVNGRSWRIEKVSRHLRRRHRGRLSGIYAAIRTKIWFSTERSWQAASSSKPTLSSNPRRAGVANNG
jgi:hypothetical protein